MIHDKRENLAHAQELLRKAARGGIDLAVLPAMFCCPQHAHLRVGGTVVVPKSSFPNRTVTMFYRYVQNVAKATHAWPGGV